jgi:putative transposase
MANTYSQNNVHIVFSTRGRRALIPADFQADFWAYTAGICKKLSIRVRAVGGTENHMHLLIEIPPAISIAKAVSAIKSNSSRWANEQNKRFTWQEGYGAFSVSHAVVPSVIRYIENQAIHHKKINFEAEFAGFLKRHEIGFDPKFAFD